MCPHLISLDFFDLIFYLMLGAYWRGTALALLGI
jgi:hypothetical protein